MITETGRVVAIDADSVIVETIRQSSCNSCAAQKGCGQSLLNKIGDGQRNHMRVLLGRFEATDFHLDDDVDIAVPEHVLVSGALVVYLLPLLCLLAGMALADHFLNSEAWAAVGAALGFAAGLGGVRLHARQVCRNPDYQPSVVAIRGNSGIDPLHFSPGEPS